jgi:DNA-binding transcriptional LysR family regulator
VDRVHDPGVRDHRVAAAQAVDQLRHAGVHGVTVAHVEVADVAARDRPSRRFERRDDRAAERIADLRPAATLSFSGYEQIIPAAVAGHGVALGRSPLVKNLLAAGDLVAPFRSSADPARAYYAIVSPSAEGRSEVAAFLAWLKEEARKKSGSEPD